MSLITHQLKTDLRRSWYWIAVFWITCSVQSILALGNLTGEAHVVSNSLLLLLQVVVITILVASTIQVDSIVSSTAGWKTRPLGRKDLFLAKTSFILLVVILPLLLTRMVNAGQMGFNFPQCLQAVGGMLLGSLPLLFFAATLAALTRTFIQFFLAATVTIAVVMVWSMILSYLHSYHGFLSDAREEATRPAIQASALVAAQVFLALCVAVAWWLQVGEGKSRWSIVGLGLGLFGFMPCIYAWRIDFLAPPPAPAVPLKVNVLAEGQSPQSQPGRQVLWSHFSVEGLNTNQVVVVTEMQASFRESAKSEISLSYQQPERFWRRESDFLARSGGNDYFRIIQEAYPPQTLWYGNWIRHPPAELPIAGELPEDYFSQSHRGRLQGRVRMALFEVNSLADLPLEKQTLALEPGLKLTVRSIELTGQEIQIHLAESTASLWLSRTARRGGFAGSSRPGSPHVFVVYHPGTGEAFTFNPNQGTVFTVWPFGSTTSTRSTLPVPYPVLRSRLTGLTPEEWIREARLQVYTARQLGSYQRDLDEPDYALTRSREDHPQQSGDAMAALKATALPAHPSLAQIGRYLNTILLNLPESWNEEEDEIIRAKLLAIGANGVPELLRRLPLEARYEYNFIQPVLRQLVTREHLPVLMAALKRDSRLVRLIRAQDWQPEIRATVLATLSDHRVPCYSGALVLAAPGCDAKTAPDFMWHFIHNEGGHDQMLSVLESCPGFDAEFAVRQAWKRARLGLASPRGLLLAAAAAGLPEALDQAILQLETSMEPRRRAEWVDHLVKMARPPAAATEAASWLLQHLGKFQYDSTTRSYSLAP